MKLIETPAKRPPELYKICSISFFYEREWPLCSSNIIIFNLYFSQFHCLIVDYGFCCNTQIWKRKLAEIWSNLWVWAVNGCMGACMYIYIWVPGGGRVSYLHHITPSTRISFDDIIVKQNAPDLRISFDDTKFCLTIQNIVWRCKIYLSGTAYASNKICMFISLKIVVERNRNHNIPSIS